MLFFTENNLFQSRRIDTRAWLEHQIYAGFEKEKTLFEVACLIVDAIAPSTCKIARIRQEDFDAYHDVFREQGHRISIRDAFSAAGSG